MIVTTTYLDLLDTKRVNVCLAVPPYSVTLSSVQCHGKRGRATGLCAVAISSPTPPPRAHPPPLPSPPPPSSSAASCRQTKLTDLRTADDNEVPHGVTALTSGVRYSLFFQQFKCSTPSVVPGGAPAA